MRRLFGFVLTAALACASTIALADDGYVTGPVTMYSGPDSSYPPIESLSAGEPVSVQGCTDGYEWCDTIWGQDRGWIPGNYIQYEQNGSPVLLPALAAAIAIPIVAFSISDYWGRYYRGRPFWGQRESWFHRSFAHRPPPRPFHTPLRNFGPRAGEERRIPQMRGAVRGPVARGPVVNRNVRPVQQHMEAPRGGARPAGHAEERGPEHH